MESIIFLAGLLFFFVIPGHAILLALNLDFRGLTNLNVSITLGLISSSVVFKVFASIGIFQTTILYSTACTLLVCYYYLYGGKKLNLYRGGIVEYIAHIVFFGLVVFTAYQYSQIPYYSLNYLTNADGISVVSNKVALLHVSIVHELVRGIPPSVPFISGIELKYHYGMELIAAMFVKFAGLGAADVLLRFLPYFSISFAMLSVYTLVRELAGTYKVAVIVVFLVIWADDFSSVFYQLSSIEGLVSGLQKKFFYTPPGFFSLFDINPMVYGLAFLFTGMTLLNTYIDRKTWPYLIICALVFASSGDFKTFVALHLLTALAICIVFIGVRVTGYLQRLLLVTVIFFVVFHFPSIYEGLTGSGYIEMKPALFTRFIPNAIHQLGLSDWFFFSTLHSIYLSRSSGFGSYLLMIIGVAWYFLLALGARSFVLPLMASTMIKRTNVFLTFAAVFVVAGVFLTVFISVRPVNEDIGYNNSVWFLVQSKYLAWIFFTPFLLYVTNYSGVSVSCKLRKGLLVTLSLVMVYYSTYTNYLLLNRFKNPKRNQVLVLDERYSQLDKKFSASCRDGEIILSDNHWVNILLIGRGCRSVLYYWGTTFAPVAVIRQREEDLNDFWLSFNEDNVVRKDILKKYQVDYLIHGEHHELIKIDDDFLSDID